MEGSVVWIAQVETTTAVAEAWGATQWIAGGAVAVALVSALVTGLAVWVAYRGTEKRVEHEAEMQRKQLAEERRAAGLATVSRAYTLAKAVGREINLYRVEQRAAAEEFGMGEESRAVVREAQSALEIVTATGWNEEVRKGASLVLRRIDGLESTAFAAVGGLRRSPSRTEIEDRVTDASAALDQAIRQYRGTLDE